MSTLTPTSGTAATTGAATATRRAAGSVGRIAAQWSLAGLLLAFVLFFSIARHGQFDTAINARSILYTQSITVIVGISALVSATVGEIDISIGAVMTVSGVLTAWAYGRGWSTGPAVALALGAALAIGAVNALLVVRFRVDSFIATLAMTTLLTGFAQLVTGGLTLYRNIPNGFNDLVASTVAGVPLLVLYAAAVAGVLAYVISWTPYGRRMRASGTGRAAAELIGVRTRRYVTAGLLAGSVVAALAGVLNTARLQSASPDGGSAVMLGSIAAVFLGAVVSRRGHLNVVGTVLAVLTLGIGISGLTMMGAPAWVPDVFNGLALIAALLISRAGRGRR
ncbi:MULTISPECIES: ABC transporter permease [Kitasatospora]|uniref:Putative sugar ABC transporter permease protein n=1 Tax=Kitasatospora setae (strain ATCC 33774 / DSM 43861 / JCM 3304 / KCC A-0304 / NBRC 14216 / KM-6054) TaxID=452652 RepID=E4N7L2_KITSK|nr:MULTISPECIES: ABC transporter permease [Kitasatospora]BAJ27193.1 putative sugar ABC transporter permease protein [Kitasatospora setae KM-6054]